MANCGTCHNRNQPSEAFNAYGPWHNYVCPTVTGWVRVSITALMECVVGSVTSATDDENNKQIIVD